MRASASASACRTIAPVITSFVCDFYLAQVSSRLMSTSSAGAQDAC
jgi:hypothetical protein